MEILSLEPDRRINEQRRASVPVRTLNGGFDPLIATARSILFWVQHASQTYVVES
jgi:hypothetical protein